MRDEATLVDADVEELMTEEEADKTLPEGVRRSLREDAASLFDQLRHKPTRTATRADGHS